MTQERRRVRAYTDIDTRKFEPVDAIEGGDPEDTQLLRDMARHAAEVLIPQPWASPIERQLLAFGVGGVLALFLFTLAEPIEESDSRELWVIVGDLPRAFLNADGLPTPAAALTYYCERMQDWADRILEGRSLEGAYSIAAEPTVEHANMLKSRLAFIREELIPIA